MSTVPPGQDEPGSGEPANRTRLAWTRTAIALAALGAAMLRASVVAGVIVIALSIPVWAAVRRIGPAPDALSSLAALRLVTATVVLVAAAALVIAFLGHGPGSLSELLHGR